MGFVGTSVCDAEGFACLGWLFAGLYAGCGAAAITIVLLARRLGLGWGFGLVTIGIASLALIPLQEEARVAVVAVAPLIAIVLTWQRSTQSAEDGSTTRRRPLRWVWLIVCSGLLIAVVGGSVVSQERRLLNSRIAEYEGVGVPVVGLPDDTTWRYDSVVALGGPGEELPQVISSYLIDGQGGRVNVETKLSSDSNVQPPRDCSTDPDRKVPCTQTVPGVYESAGQSNQRILAFDSVVVRVTVFQGTISADELDTLCASLQPTDPRSLAVQQSWLYRLIG